ncbi:MAG: AzlC family ABC transporter permease [Cellulosilyticum sp.]|nr:AzlC family ABC transporter permease [Cellulosilyticum sp.]
MKKQNQVSFKKGLKLGVPIGIGYFSVSFAFGMMAVSSGLSPALAVLISMTNLTSAGQFAGLQVMTSGGSYVEMALTMLMINARYFLMSLSLSQKVSKKLSSLQRALMSFCVTDEIFAVASMESGDVTGWYWAGLMSMPYLGWSGGTLAGALVSGILPASLQDALGIALYGMFIAIIIPAAKHSKAIVMTLAIAVTASCILYYIPSFDCISSGFAVIIVTVISAGLMAYIAPIKEEKDEEEETCISC